MTDENGGFEMKTLETIALQMLSKDPEIRENAIDHLLEVAFEKDIGEDVMGPVLDKLDQADLNIQRDIIRELPKLLAGSTAPLIKLLASPVTEIRYAAVDALREIVPDSDDLEEVARLLQHPDREIRFSAAELLQDEGRDDLIPDDVAL